MLKLVLKSIWSLVSSLSCWTLSINGFYYWESIYACNREKLLARIQFYFFGCFDLINMWLRNKVFEYREIVFSVNKQLIAYASFRVKLVLLSTMTFQLPSGFPHRPHYRCKNIHYPPLCHSIISHIKDSYWIDGISWIIYNNFSRSFLWTFFFFFFKNPHEHIFQRMQTTTKRW